MPRPIPKKFCCETMEKAWQANIIGWNEMQYDEPAITMLWPYDHGAMKVFRDEPIYFCPWCGFRLKVKRPQ